MKYKQFFTDIYSLEPRRAVDAVVDQLDDLLLAGKFSECESILLLADPEKMDDPVIISFLGITLAAKQTLRDAREMFVDRAIAVLASRHSHDFALGMIGKYR